MGGYFLSDDGVLRPVLDGEEEQSRRKNKKRTPVPWDIAAEQLRLKKMEEYRDSLPPIPWEHHDIDGNTYEGPLEQFEGDYGTTRLPINYHPEWYERGMRENGWLPIGASDWEPRKSREAQDPLIDALKKR